MLVVFFHPYLKLMAKGERVWLLLGASKRVGVREKSFHRGLCGRPTIS